MARQIVVTPKAAKPPPAYSQAVKAGGLVFVSGTAPRNGSSGFPPIPQPARAPSCRRASPA